MSFSVFNCLFFALFWLANANTNAKTDNSEIDKRAFNYVFKNVAVNTRPVIVEVLFQLGDTLMRMPQIPDANAEGDETELPIQNSTVNFKLSDDVYTELNPNQKIFYDTDPLGFRLYVRRLAERAARRELLEDLRDFWIGPRTVSETLTEIPTKTFSLHPAFKSKLSSILHDGNSVTSTSTTDADYAYATEVLSSLASQLSASIETQATSTATQSDTAAYTYETSTTRVRARGNIPAFTTSYRVLQRVPQTDTSSAQITTCTTGQSVIGATPTCGATRVNYQAAAAAAVAFLGVVVAI